MQPGANREARRNIFIMRKRNFARSTMSHLPP
jgi:hypothetical protein